MKVGRPHIPDFEKKKQIPRTIKFDTEEEAKEFVKNYEEPYQLSAISKGKEKYYIALPNPVSKAITNGIKKAEEFLNVRVPMGYEWIIGKNWAQCH